MLTKHTSSMRNIIKRKPRAGNKRSMTEEQHKDPICGMDVEPGTAAGSHAYRGQTYYFCCVPCLEKFRAEPEKYLDPSAPVHHESHSSESPGGLYTCPMDPEVRQPGPAPCPKCGMALEPLDPAAMTTKTEYVCPMHPEIVRSEPGS